MTNWIEQAIFYHIYPLGFCDAPRFCGGHVTHRIQKMIEWIPHIKEMGFNAIYFGPLFESYEHGYDTSDYRLVDKRLGNNNDLKEICDILHEQGIRIVFDGVFNHVGREFWAFKDVIEKRENSAYCDWFSNLHFDQNNPMNDGFTYDTWQGYYNLVKLNLRNDEVITYLLESVGMWIKDFHVDGLRLDAADCVDKEFFKRLKTYTKEMVNDFWLMGEIIHGDYTMWANQDMLDSVTNYECYKGIYSSHNDKNYFEIAHSLNRQFGKGGIYEGLHLYNFVDNHDVNRIASTVNNPLDLENIYTLLYTMPGIPSVYYGSEWGVKGKKHDGSDADIRPCIHINDMTSSSLTSHIKKLCNIRSIHPTLFYGTHEAILIKNEQFVFKRSDACETVYIALNVSDEPCNINLPAKHMIDLLTNTKYPFTLQGTSVTLQPKSSCIFIEDKYAFDINDEKEVVKETVSVLDEQKERKVANIDHETTIQTCFNDLPVVENEIQIGRYEHFKGKHYSVLYIATHSETLEKQVVYRQLYGNGDVWTRPLSMFCENVIVEGKQVPRFKYIGS